MKKYIFIVLILVVMITFISCNEQATEAFTTTTTPLPQVTLSETVSPTQPPNNYISYHFSSYDEFQSAVSGDRSQEFQNTVQSEAPKLMPLLNCLPITDEIPQLMKNNKVISLMDRSNAIVLFDNELYNAPMIMYHCEYEGIHVRARVSYVSLFDVEAVEGKLTIATLAKALKPNYPSPENYETIEWSEFVEDKNITVNGESVFARITTATGIHYDRVEYLHNGLYVAIEAPDFVEFYEEFFENFTIQ